MTKMCLDTFLVILDANKYIYVKQCVCLCVNKVSVVLISVVCDIL